jgi:hypothetical protein
MKARYSWGANNFSFVSPIEIQWNHWVIPHGTPFHALQVVLLSLKSVSNERHLSLKVETVFRPYLPHRCGGPLSNTTLYSLRMRYKQCNLRWRRSVMKGSLLLMWKQFFVRMSLRTAVGSLNNNKWYAQRTCYKQCKFNWSRSAIKCTLLLRSRQFFFRISPMIALGSLKNTTWYSLRMC